MAKVKFKVLDTFIPAVNSDKRYIDIWGGRGRGGSYYGTQYFLMRIMHPSYFRGYFLRQAFKDIRDSLWRDFKDRVNEMVEAGEINDSDFHWNENEMRVTYLPTGNTIISKGVHKDSQRTAKLKSLAGATHVLIEEADEINEDDFNQLDDSLRTVKTHVIQIIRIFNPPQKRHWIWRDYVLTDSEQEGYMTAACKNPDILSIFSTYYDNRININDSTASKWEQYITTNPDHYWTIIRGLVSEGKRGRIFRNWKIITDAEFDDIDRPIAYGLDFGYSEDPTALVAVKFYNEHVYVKELVYQTGLSDPALLEIIRAKCDLSRPMIADTGGGGDLRIANLRRGFGSGGLGMIRSAVKGSGSVNAGISQMQGMEVHVTEGSTNLITEYNEYCWQLDANKEPTDSPIDKYNHCIDALRYVVLLRRSL
jgi:phage terminase large subunit